MTTTPTTLATPTTPTTPAISGSPLVMPGSVPVAPTQTVRAPRGPQARRQARLVVGAPAVAEVRCRSASA